MKPTRIVSLTLAALALPVALCASPAISSVSFTQQPDGAGSTKIVVSYSLASPDGPTTATLLYSLDGAPFVPASTVSGNVGPGQTTGTLFIDWAVSNDLPGGASSALVLRVLAEDGMPIPLTISSTQAAQSVSQTATQTFTFTFAEPVTGFDASDVAVAGGTKGAFTGSGAVYSLAVTGTGGTVTASVAPNAAASVASGTATLGDSYSNFFQDVWTISLPGGVPMELIRIPAGTFTMGSPLGETSRGVDETQRVTTISEDFYLGRTEVTQQQWLAVRGNFPLSQLHGTSDTLALHRVAHIDITDPTNGFMKRLNDHITATGQGPGFASLPTEAQWEYACRAGTTTRFNFGDGLHPTNDENCGTTAARIASMWYCGNSGSLTQLVAQKPPNAWGLWDMHGNLWEWCADFYTAYDPLDTSDPAGPASGTSRVVRGGSWGSGAQDCRAAQRNNYTPANRIVGVGFRVLAVR